MKRERERESETEEERESEEGGGERKREWVQGKGEGVCGREIRRGDGSYRDREKERRGFQISQSGSLANPLLKPDPPAEIIILPNPCLTNIPSWDFFSFQTSYLISIHYCIVYTLPSVFQCIQKSLL